IKAAPRRVVVLDVGEFDNVVSLGLKPVGYAPSEGDAAIPSYLEKGAGEPKSVGTINSLNLEAIAGLQPDLILGSQLRAADKYDELSKIAPTVFSIRPGFTWKENYLLNAQALDRTKQAESALAAYEALLARYEAREGYDADHRVDIALHHLGLPGLRRERPLGTLSGGERSRLALAGVLAGRPE
ncbi:ABC transporter substrate-binding protein, partial [Streptomyces sp. DH12]|uniref:ABC transporter substrate-binding protein n=1 Tax=Streptomyces sp. DH12 TaxID=2857010 RepID=UPI001E362ADD